MSTDTTSTVSPPEPLRTDIPDIENMTPDEIREHIRRLSAMRDTIADSEKFYREIVEGVNSIILRWKPDGILTFVNRFAMDFFGYNRDELIGNSITVFVPDRESDGRDLSTLIRDIAADPEKYHHFENENIRKNGSRAFVTWANRPIFDEQGGLSEILSVGNDITRLHDAEQALQRSEKRLDAFFANSPVRMGILDENLRYVRVNEITAHYFGKKSDDIRGMSIWETAPDFAPMIEPKIRSVLETGEPLLNFEITGTLPGHPSEILHWISSYFPLALPEDKKGIGLIAIDITERKRIEEELKITTARAEAESAQLQTILDNLAEGLVAFGVDGHILQWNSAAAEMHQLTEQEKLRVWVPELQTVFEISTVDGTVLPIDQWPHARILRGEHLHELELEFHRFDSGWRRIFSYGGSLAYDPAGHPLLGIMTIQDITERKQSEERAAGLLKRLRRQTTQLTATNRELEAFSYSVSHDLRAPLRSIDGFSLALMEDYGGKLGGDGEDYLRRIRNAVARMSQLIEDILNFSRTTRAEMNYTTVDLSALARSIIGNLRESAPERQVETVIEDGMTAQGDERLLRQALENLLGNAWKFTSHTPDARIEFGERRQDGKTVYFVRDNGAGFDMKYADNLFVPFRRLHPENEFPGTGIGLSLVRRIISRHGGNITAEGEPGKGATFSFTLQEEG